MFVLWFCEPKCRKLFLILNNELSLAYLSKFWNYLQWSCCKMTTYNALPCLLILRIVRISLSSVDMFRSVRSFISENRFWIHLYLSPLRDTFLHCSLYIFVCQCLPFNLSSHNGTESTFTFIFSPYYCCMYVCVHCVCVFTCLYARPRYKRNSL